MSKVIGSITGSNKQAKAATQAAKTQSDATKYASDLQQKQYEQTRADLSPYTQAGTNALAQMTGFNPSSYQGSNWTLGQYTSNLPDAAVHENYNGPSYEASEFNFEESPGYQYRKQQGMDGIQSSAAASGGLLSGATLKALNNHNNNLASQEYNTAHSQYLQNEGLKQTEAQMGLNQYATQANLQQNNFNNALAADQIQANNHQQAFNNWQSQDNNAYNRYMTDQNNQYSRLANLVGIGQSSAAQVGNAGMQTAQAVANNTMAGANATASGQIAAGNRTANNFNSLLGAAGTIGGLFI